jgi:hypothetical protein
VYNLILRGEEYCPKVIKNLNLLLGRARCPDSCNTGRDLFRGIDLYNKTNDAESYWGAKKFPNPTNIQRRLLLQRYIVMHTEVLRSASKETLEDELRLQAIAKSNAQTGTREMALCAAEGTDPIKKIAELISKGYELDESVTTAAERHPNLHKWLTKNGCPIKKTPKQQLREVRRITDNLRELAANL